MVVTAARATVLQGLPRLTATEDVRELAAEILRAGLVPRQGCGGCLTHCGGRRAPNGHIADLELHSYS